MKQLNKIYSFGCSWHHAGINYYKIVMAEDREHAAERLVKGRGVDYIIEVFEVMSTRRKKTFIRKLLNAKNP